MTDWKLANNQMQKQTNFGHALTHLSGHKLIKNCHYDRFRKTVEMKQQLQIQI